MKNRWRVWRHSSPPPIEDHHSIKEVEHRFTVLETDRQELHETVEAHSEKLLTHERAIIALVIGLSALFQEQFPRAAALLKAALP